MKEAGKKGKIVLFLHLLIYLCIVISITLVTRTPVLERSVHMTLLWSYVNSAYWLQIALNAALFVPVGFFLVELFNNSRLKNSKYIVSIICAFIVSSLIEYVQYISYRGIVDIDDVLSNACGAIVGIAAWMLIQKSRFAGVKRQIGWIFIAAGLAGCFIAVAASDNNSIDSLLMRQFFFSVDNIETVENAGCLSISGRCYTYNRITPDYQILLDGLPVTTTILENEFSLEAEIPEEKVEVQVQFQGYQPMGTGIFLDKRDGEVSVEYVPGDISGLKGANGILKAYNKDYDTYIYQDGNLLTWFIGWDIDASTEIIYHLYTNEPEKLPEARKQYKFDNRGFRLGSDKERSEFEGFKVFEDIIPQNYNVTAVVVGFSTQGKIIWMKSFRVD